MTGARRTVDWARSERIAAIVDAEEGLCVANVVRAITTCQHELPSDTVYVEGLWVVDGQLDIHAWLEADTTIIDPTLVRLRHSHYPDAKRSEPLIALSIGEISEEYAGREIGKGDRLALKLDWSDSRVRATSTTLDPP